MTPRQPPRAAAHGATPDAVPALRVLLDGAIDYAGLFPPAALSMADAVREYAAYRRSADAWALGRFVVPAARLEELLLARAAVEDDARPWPVAVVAGGDSIRDAGAIAAGPAAGARRDGIEVAALEAPVHTPGEVAKLAAAAGARACFCELAADGGPVDGMLLAIRQAGARAKLRTGGLVPQAIPAAVALAAVLEGCARLGVAFKATAGLHHPFRGVHALTADANGARGRMHGFVPLALAAALLARARPEERLQAAAVDILEATGADGFRADRDGVRWLGHRWTTADVAAGRRLLVAFGSCSFLEPMADLRALGLLA